MEEHMQNHDGQLEIYGTFGPSCHETEILEKMLEAGMTGIRLNLSHGSLQDNHEWVENLKKAKEKTGRSCKLLIDLQGRERRLGKFEAFEAKMGDHVFVGEQIPVGGDVLVCLEPGDMIRIGDHNIPLRILEREGLSWKAEVLGDGLFEPGKSLHIQNKDSSLPILYAKDIENLKIATQMGVTGVMVPFVQNAQDLKEIRSIIQEYAPESTVMAKIENIEGVRNLESILPLADEIVIARGDLAASCTLEWMPAVQNYIEAKCHQNGKPYMVVTQMLDSMEHHPTPTRAEVTDIYNAVMNGAHSIMLTGETAHSLYPLEAMEYFCKIAHNALQLKTDPQSFLEVFKTL